LDAGPGWRVLDHPASNLFGDDGVSGRARMTISVRQVGLLNRGAQGRQDVDDVDARSLEAPE
jgi:hypothetical protein